jgi:hypothetical protein
MKRLIFLLTLISVLFSLFSCSQKYPPVESSSEELKTVYTIDARGDKYEIKYELYRALFNSLKGEVDKGDNSVWTGAYKNEYIKKIDEMIVDYASEIYSAFTLCRENGIDVYSKSFENAIDDYISASVEGGEVNGLLFAGFGGDYQKYLDSLSAIGVNYSVQRLLLRYSLAIDALTECYIGENLKDGPHFGKIQYSEKTIKDFYYSDECVHVMYAFLSSDAYTLERANEVRDTIAKKENANDVASYIIGHTTSLVASDVKFGLLIAKNNLDLRYFGEIVDAAFSLSVGETSPVHVLNTGSENGFVITYRIDKSDDFLKEKYQNAVDVYLQNEFGKILESAKDEFFNTREAKTNINEFDFSKMVINK